MGLRLLLLFVEVGMFCRGDIVFQEDLLVGQEVVQGLGLDLALLDISGMVLDARLLVTIVLQGTVGERHIVLFQDPIAIVELDKYGMEDSVSL